MMLEEFLLLQETSKTKHKKTYTLFFITEIIFIQSFNIYIARTSLFLSNAKVRNIILNRKNLQITN